MSKPKVLVCGASGFIGRNIFEDLLKSDELDVFGTFHRKKFSDTPRLLQVDLTSWEKVERLLTDRDWGCVIHAAAVTDGYLAVSANPAKYIAANIIMNTLLGEAAFKFRVPHFIFMSCTTVYPHFLNRPVTEDDTVFTPEQLHPKYFGGAWVKLSTENVYRYFSTIGDTKFAIIRHSNIYGPHDKFDLDRGHVLAATIHKIMQAANGGTVTIWGEGKEKRDFLHVSGLVRFVRLATANLQKRGSKFEVYNVGLGASISIRDMAELVLRLSGKSLKIEFDASKPSVQSELVLNIEKAKIIGWQPLSSLTEGIAQTIDWYQRNIL